MAQFFFGDFAGMFFRRVFSKDPARCWTFCVMGILNSTLNSETTGGIGGHCRIFSSLTGSSDKIDFTCWIDFIT